MNDKQNSKRIKLGDLGSNMNFVPQREERWTDINRILTRPSPYGNETGKLPNGVYEPTGKLIETLHDSKILVVGAGGLGCEILKDLALSGFTQIHVIDLDTIDISNLNRQFLFRTKDVGRPKSQVAAEFIMNRVKGCKVTPYHGKIQDYKSEFYAQFHVIISGLDNIEARRWLNSVLVNLVQLDTDGDIDPDSIIPLVDGGTEGFKGQARVIIPKITSCFECSLDSFPPQQSFPMCTIAETPRIAEHCIAYAYIMEWDRVFPTTKLDKDSPEHMQWIYERALERANKFNIEGVTYFKTMGVVKNIIPAVASTNAIVSAACVNEVIKLRTYCSQTMNNYCMYMGSESIYTHTFDYERKPICVVCSDEANTKVFDVNSQTTLQEFIDTLISSSALQLKKPSVMGQAATLYMQNPPTLEAVLRPNLLKPLSDLIENSEILTVTDPTLCDISLSIQVNFL